MRNGRIPSGSGTRPSGLRSCQELPNSSLRLPPEIYALHQERPHQGLDNRLIRPAPGHVGNTGAVQQHQRWDGMLNYYYRTAA
jgi:hypothetical protein